MAPEDVSSAKGRIWLSQSGTMVAQNTSDTMTQMARLCGAPKDEYVPNHRSFETQNQAGSDDAGGKLNCAARAFGDGPDRAAVRTLKQVRALAGSRIPESVPDLMTRS